MFEKKTFGPHIFEIWESKNKKMSTIINHKCYLSVRVLFSLSNNKTDVNYVVVLTLTLTLLK
jgi:hypothetical protein